ncbi:DUF4296 domain-containing protein [Lutibacter flavus]|uniref:DUF4296 domain-containing protein n=1 Tax=Lutibacter flavus TaxID=691689 RepID=A0A238X457_9FLAO|nr:DUF4296 domain-containing protein [Lutibacter flavus]SNR53432.1 protein of unknown function [Lutibacter flavus]
MNKFFYILFIAVFFMNCTSNTILKKPDNLIPKDQMVDVLTDLFLAINAETTKNIQLERKVNYYPLIFEKYGIDSTRFKESNYYYTSRVDDYDEILDKIESRLKNLNEQFENERKIEDSISRMKNKTDRKVKKPIRK